MTRNIADFNTGRGYHGEETDLPPIGNDDDYFTDWMSHK